MSSENARRTSAVEKFAGNRIPEDEEGVWTEEPPWEAQYRRTWRVARPRGREDIMLDCRASTGHRKAFSYAWLSSITYEPGTTITLVFGEMAIVLEGRNLDRLYDALVQHRVPYVQEGSEAEDALKPEQEPHIERLTLEQVKEEE